MRSVQVHIGKTGLRTGTTEGAKMNKVWVIAASLVTIGAMGVTVAVQREANRQLDRQLAETARALKSTRETVKALEDQASQLATSLAQATARFGAATNQIAQYQELLNAAKAAAARPTAPDLRAEAPAVTVAPVVAPKPSPPGLRPPGGLRILGQ
jgi:septal ring factor EnvC (AmiA/AmiB activator)